MNKQVMFWLGFASMLALCCYEAYVVWGVPGLLLGVPAALAFTVAGFMTFSPK